MTSLTTLALDGSSVDGGAYRDVTRLAAHAPGWLDDAVSAWSAYGLAVFAALMVVAWWRARRSGPTAALAALAVPVVVVVAYALNDVLKLLVREDRPCRSLHVATLEACPAPGDWSFPSNHAAIAAAAAVALLCVSRRLGAVAVVAACAMGASRVWVGAHYPHDVVAGLLTGAVVGALLMAVVRRWPRRLADRLTVTRLRLLLVA
ncbi:phosphatase PAP2 family protein [Streptomyces longispororuber]|uniref:phosphatase PAP2 family protein n=1 Tax=Streptomyces longispororuber TaxID=68230 RepID=UPI00210E4FF8|nr:phosphatase PAP2 family protein [Streptomyces longispororuber]MCQ4211395.1 phosphatase PAP2 family protein [Streptomyces longispororuber]